MVQSLTRRLKNGLFLSPECAGSCYLSNINRLLLRDLGFGERAVSFFVHEAEGKLYTSP